MTPPRRCAASTSRPARKSRYARPIAPRTRIGSSTLTQSRTEGPIAMPMASSRAPAGTGSQGTSPRTSGTMKATAATIARPVKEVEATGPGSDRPDAEEERPVLLAQRPQPHARGRGEPGAGEDPPDPVADQQRTDGQAELVEQAGRGELAVEARAALGQHRAGAGVAKGAEGAAQVHPAVARHHHV